MTYCECSSCRKIPKETEVNPDCEVSKLRLCYQDIFPSWKFSASYNINTKKSSLYLISQKKFVIFTIDHIKKLIEKGYRVLNIKIQLLNFETDDFIDDGDCFCDSDTAPQFKPVIYVEKI